MKTLLVAAAAAVLAACSAPTSEVAVSETSANDTDAVTDTTTKDVTIDLAAIDASLKCVPDKGYRLVFDFQGRTYEMVAGANEYQCQEILGGFKLDATRTGTITKEHGSMVRWTLALEGDYVFTAFSSEKGDDGTVLTTITPVDLTLGTDLSNVRCIPLKGMYLSVDFQGHHFRQFQGIGLSACQAELVLLNAQPTHTGELEVVTYEGGTTRQTLILDEGQFRLDAWISE